MPATPQTIWQAPVYLPYLQPPLTDQTIAAAEKQLGYKLPAEYLDLLRVQNGGYIRFKLPDMCHKQIAGIGPYFPSLLRFNWDEVQEYVSFPLRGLIPFDGDGHWHLCFDYRRSATVPQISYVDVECDRQSTIADSFRNYLSMLQLEPKSGYAVESEENIDALIDRLASALSVSFAPPNSFAHGYPEYRAALGTPDDPQWLWVSPNKVPRGFVRPDNARYEQLKNLLPGFARRFPEIPESACFLAATEEVRPRVLDACARARINVRPIISYFQ